MKPGDELKEGQSDVTTDRLTLFCHVDNIGILGVDQAEVSNAMVAVQNVLE